MNEFLKEAKEGLATDGCVHVVLSNPSCDLDSAVCTVVYGHVLSRLKGANVSVVPVLNILRADYPLRTEVRFQFQKHGITSDLLLFRDDVHLEALSSSRDFQLHLVDHHVLSEADQVLNGHVTEVLDHRPKAKEFPSSTKVTLELVGSCCTLITEVVIRECADLLTADPRIASLLHGTIILDTCNFSETAKRGTPKDKNMVEHLEAYLPEVDREDIHRTLLAARADTSSLTTCQLLMKDLKCINNIAIPSIPMLIHDLWLRGDIVDSLETMSNAWSCQAVLLLGLEHKDQSIVRQLAVYSSNSAYRDRIVDSLSSCTSPSLELEPLSLGGECPRVVAFHQRNFTASRKIILPIVQAIDFSNEPVINPEIQEPRSPLPCPNGLNPRALQQAAHYLGVADQTLSSGSSSNQTSCPYTPLNSCADDGVTQRDHTLPSFNSRDMVEKIRLKRGKLQGYESAGLGCESTLPSCPFTPANSFVESTLDHIYSQKSNESETLSEELLLRKLEEKHLYEEGEEEQERDFPHNQPENPGIKLTNPIIKVPDSESDWDPHSATSLSTYKTCLSNGDKLEDNPRSEVSDATEADQSFQLDLDIPAEGYCAETVEFPSSPGEMRKLTVVPEEELQTQQGDDDDTSTYRAVLSPTQPHVRLTKERPANMPKKKKRIVVPAEILSGEGDETASISQQLDSDTELDLDLLTPDDLETPDDFDDSIMDRLDESSERIPEMSATEELAEERNWRSVIIAGIERRIDCKVIEPYKKVLSHGGYLKQDSHLAIIVFSACYLPDRSRKDYSYVMDNLFLYCLTTLDQLVAEDYVLVYLHGATRRSCMPTFGWLRRAYQMIDHRLRKNLKGLYLTHPTFWLKTIVALTKPFVSTKFSRKLRFVRSLEELSRLIPLDQVVIPDRVKQYDEIRKTLQL